MLCHVSEILYACLNLIVDMVQDVNARDVNQVQ